MKTYMTLAALSLCTLAFGQHKEPKHELDGALVKSTYYHDNGRVSQTGYYKDGKVHGDWMAYDEQGNKTSKATYESGVKTGTWFFWQGEKLQQVDYSDSKIAAVKSWHDDAVVINK